MSKTEKKGNYSDTMDMLLNSEGKQGSRILLETGTNELEILEFYLISLDENGNEIKIHFGINVAKIKEVIDSPALEKPISPPHPSFMGVIPLRGYVLPLIDISTWLGLKKREGKREMILVTEFSNTVTGFLVSGVVEIHRLKWEEVLPPHQYVLEVGSTSITGTVNKGGHFIQILDLEHVISDVDPENADKTWQTTVISKTKYSLLIADDSATIRMMLKKNLESANFKITQTSNGKEALDYLINKSQELKEQGKTIKDDIQLLISDIEMPMMDGFSLTKNVKEHPDLKDMPVILYSSIITKELRHKGDVVGADKQVSKPDLNQMAEMVLELLEK